MVLFVAGCATNSTISTPPYYPPNPSAILLKHQGEIDVRADVSTGGETFLAAYALTPHVGLLADGSLALHKSGNPNGNQYSGDVGIGIFDTSVNGHMIREVYGAFGLGTGTSQISSPCPSSTESLVTINNNEHTQFATVWLQGATGYCKQNFSFAVLTRLSYSAIYKYLNQESIQNPYNLNGKPMGYDTSFVKSAHFFILTPGFEARFGFNQIKLIASIFESLPGASNYSPYIAASLGVCNNF